MNGSGNFDITIIHGNFTISDDIFRFMMSEKFNKGKVDWHVKCNKFN